ncbi:unnamed protein product [Cyprideis torosa]|uniref:Uncharacterized protein n=1 Tax=Cyprideis torosa TaxID=163714 RepID=A0A7R8WXE5_9CRUS|nr:unnamed protein product [Cyprideis torosa]CAG0910894.1 unnamed protein product [Cyprideis torosa]
MSGKQLKKSELVAAIAEASGADKKTANNVVDALVNVITSEVAAGNAVVLPGVGKFQAKDRPARTVRNPSTGESMEKAADKTVRVTVAKALKDANIGAINNLQRVTHIVIGNNHANIAIHQMSHELTDIINGDRVNTCKWLVEQNIVWIGCKRASNFNASPFAA